MTVCYPHKRHASSGDEGLILRGQLGTLEGDGKMLKGTHVDESVLSSVGLEGLKLQNQCPDEHFKAGTQCRLWV